jgi:DNA-binding transcriptional LysR family regulator
MKYICLGYIEPGKFEGMTEDERHAVFDECCSEHRVRADKLSIKEYLQLEHAVVRAESRTEEVIESYLARKKIRRQVVLSTPHFASVPIIVAQSDFIVTIPEPLARYFSSVAAGVRVVRLPFDPPRIAIKQFWHRKFHHDVRSRWLRALVCELFQRTDAACPFGKDA